VCEVCEVLYWSMGPAKRTYRPCISGCCSQKVLRRLAASPDFEVIPKSGVAKVNHTFLSEFTGLARAPGSPDM